MDVDPVFLMLSGAAMGAAAAYGFARSKYQQLLTEEVRSRGTQVESARTNERSKIEGALKKSDEALDAARTRAEELRRELDAARRDAENAQKEAQMLAREESMRAIDAMKDETRKQIADLQRQGALRDERVAERERELAKLEATIRQKEAAADKLRAEAATLVDDLRARLEAIAGLSGEEARRRMMDEMLDGIRRDVAREAKTIEDLAKQEADKRAKRIVGIAIQRYAGEQVQERATTVVHLPNDEMKGRIIGREGRNIRALQETCGVDFIVDDTPEVIVISGFDPVRREIARVALGHLIQDGRIHPSRIEEVVAKAHEEVERGLDDAAERAMIELGITKLHPEIVKLLGRLHHRYSYAQNVLKHSIECGFLCGLMASELGQNERLARRAGLLHDIGKAVSHEHEGGHAVIGGQIARKHGEEALVVNGIACHHDDEPAISVIGNLVTAADALSGARPGARREMLEGYVKRLKDLEGIALRFAGVERAFALQAGREVRVMVEPSEVSDIEAALLAREISKRIEDELSYPGQIRVTIVRETRAIDYAK